MSSTGLAEVTGVGLATVQDAGRRGYTSIGVPVAGAWHRARYEAAVQLVSGVVDAHAPAIEVLAGSLSLRALIDVVVSVVGPARVAFGQGTGATGVALLLHAQGDIVVTPTNEGPVYVAISGWTPPTTLGSCSVDTFSRLGGGPLAVGDLLVGQADLVRRDRIGWFQRSAHEPSGPVRMVAVDRDWAPAFTARRWRVERTARSGTRLRCAGWQGPGESVESFPVIPGAIQLTPDGEAIVLGPDGSLTGGYPVVGVVTTVDLDRISTFAVGDEFAFLDVDATAAVAAWSDDVEARSQFVAHPSLLA